MATPEEILQAAQQAADDRRAHRLIDHAQTMQTLRGKGWSFARIAKFLTEHGCTCSTSGVVQILKRSATLSA